MTPFESQVLRYMTLKGIVSWSQLGRQFCMSEGLREIVLNSLKRHLQIQQWYQYYRVTSIGRDALERFVNPQRPEPFAGCVEW